MNSVSLIGNLCRDVELRYTPSGTAVTTMRIAVNEREKDASGQWVDRPSYFDVVVWGKQAENCNTYLAKGRKIGVSGRLRWREWEAQDGTKRQAVEIVAWHVDFLTPRDGGGGSRPPETDFDPGAGASTSDFNPGTTDDDVSFAGAQAADSDIPF